MPKYVNLNETACILNARDARGGLSAFFVLEQAAEQFDTYLLGCHSKKNYMPHASDLLFAEMISYARERGKPAINLGLGVDEGIRRFKIKWGGLPYLNYEFCECYYGPPGPISILDALG
jgi:lipid II:glycine glycyltransferase (peptidoglycan interpeptide bridge formation enzyme)